MIGYFSNWVIKKLGNWANCHPEVQARHGTNPTQAQQTPANGPATPPATGAVASLIATVPVASGLHPSSMRPARGSATWASMLPGKTVASAVMPTAFQCGASRTKTSKIYNYPDQIPYQKFLESVEVNPQHSPMSS